VGVHDFHDLFDRHPGNPIITAASMPYRVSSVFNPGAADVDGETLLLMRVEDRRGMSHLTVARSADGLTGWRIDAKPTLSADPEGHPEELWGIEDPRITYLQDEGRWFIAYTAYSAAGPCVALASTTDFRSFERMGPVMPAEDKDAALFPVKFDGRYAMIHRPITSHPAPKANIWLSFSADLKHWGSHQVLLPAREGGWWDANKVGLSPPPLACDRGWLVMYHGVRTTISGGSYRLGLALLDRDDPSKVLRRADEWIFTPTEPYERNGDVDEVVFPCGWLLKGDELRMYYGAADTCIAVATASLSDILAWLDSSPAVHRP
jgi:predicted GH43/DUF377 family glycosyl hydrolase